MSTGEGQFNPGQAPVYRQSQPWEALSSWGAAPPPRMDNDVSPGPAPWERSRSKRFPTWAMVLIAVGAVMLICAGCMGAVLNTSGSDMSVSSGTDDQPDNAVYKVGQTVRVGEFEYTVHGVKCKIDRAGDKFLGQDAQGSFCKVDLTVRNVSRAPVIFYTDTMIKARDSAGREFSVDGFATIYGNRGGSAFAREINPGNQVREGIYFDVPDGSTLVKLEINDGGLLISDTATVEVP